MQFGPPVVHPLYQARKGAMGFGIADRDLDLMPLILEAEVERAQIAGFSHAQEMHQPRSNIAAINAMRSTSARSEEHTSELQSLMSLSYAVFCLKKKNNNRR